MSKALPIAVAVVLGGAALVPVYFASQKPAVQAATSTQPAANASAVAKISYALGYEVAHQTPPELDIDSFVTGVRAGHARTQPAYTEEELQQAYVQFQKDMQQKQHDQVQQVQVASDTFLAENAKKPGVVTYTINNRGIRINNDLFPHCKTREQKIYMMGYMAKKLIQTSLGILPADDRDSYLNKRIELTGTLLNNLFRNYFNKLVKEMQKQVIREINTGSWRSTEDYENIINMTITMKPLIY